MSELLAGNSVHRTHARTFRTPMSKLRQKRKSFRCVNAKDVDDCNVSRRFTGRRHSGANTHDCSRKIPASCKLWREGNLWGYLPVLCEYKPIMYGHALLDCCQQHANFILI